MTAAELTNFLYILILVVASILLIVIVIALDLPKIVVEKLKYVIQIIWGVIP